MYLESITDSEVACGTAKSTELKIEGRNLRKVSSRFLASQAFSEDTRSDIWPTLSIHPKSSSEIPENCSLKELEPKLNNSINSIPQPSQMSQKTYDLRRVLESALILSLDTPKISPMHECYYLIPTPWLDAWSSFINSQSSVPPPRLNLTYFLNVDGHLKQGLSPIENYRAINSTQYHVFLYLYSTDSSPPQIRSSVDLYSPELSNKRIEEYVKSGSIRGRIEVNRLLIRVREGGGLGGAEKVEREVEEEEVRSVEASLASRGENDDNEERSDELNNTILSRFAPRFCSSFHYH